MCQGTGSIRPGALSNMSASEHHIGVCIATLGVGTIINAALYTGSKPIDPAAVSSQGGEVYSIIAGQGCEVYTIEMKHFHTLCHTPAMLQALTDEIHAEQERIRERREVLHATHANLQQEADVLLHPRPKQEQPGERPNLVQLKPNFHARPVKMWSKAGGSRSFSKAGNKVGQHLKSQPANAVHNKTLSHGPHSAQKTISERRSWALGIHQLEHVKLKHAQGVTSKDAQDVKLKDASLVASPPVLLPHSVSHKPHADDARVGAGGVRSGGALRSASEACLRSPSQAHPMPGVDELSSLSFDDALHPSGREDLEGDDAVTHALSSDGDHTRLATLISSGPMEPRLISLFSPRPRDGGSSLGADTRGSTCEMLQQPTVTYGSSP